MKKPIIAGVLIFVILILGYFGYRTVDKRTNEQIKAFQNFDTVEFEKLTGLKVKTKANEIPIKEVVEEKATTEKKKETTKKTTTKEKNTKKAEKSPSKTTKKITTKKKVVKSTPKVSYNKSELQQYAHDLVISYGWSEYDYEYLIKLWNRESGWNPNAVNKKSGACGIPQSLPCKKMASEGSDYKTNGKTQIRWGLKYIKNRYGSPSSAWAHSQQKGWY